MVQVLPKIPTFGEEFGRALGIGAGEGIERGMEHRKKMAELAKENQEIYEATGIKLRSLDPEMRKLEFQEGLKNKYKLGQEEAEFSRRMNLINQAKGVKNPSFQQQINPQQNPEAQVNFDKSSQMEQPKSQSQEDPFADAELYALLGEKDLSNVSLQRAKSKLHEKEISPEFQREQMISKEQAKADTKYYQELQEASKQHELKKQTLNRLEQLNKKGVTGKPYEKLLEKTGLVALTSEGRREFAADVKNLITDIRSILGSQFTGFEFQTILNAYPSPDFSQEANAAIIKNLKDFQDIKEQEVKIANQLIKENDGKKPVDFQAKVNEKVHEYAMSKVPDIKENMNKILREQYNISPGNVLMFDPEGQPLDVPSSEVEKYLELGATL